MVRDRSVLTSHWSCLHLPKSLGLQKQLSGSLMLEESNMLRFSTLLDEILLLFIWGQTKYLPDLKSNICLQGTKVCNWTMPDYKCDL